VRIWTACCANTGDKPNTKQLNIRIPPAAKRMIERLAKRKTVEVSTPVRMWVIDSMRREAAGSDETGYEKDAREACVGGLRGRRRPMACPA